MKHFIFHLPVLISEKALDPDPDYEGQVTVRDAGRQSFDVHVHAEDLEAAKRAFQNGLRVTVGDVGSLTPDDYHDPFLRY